MSFIIGIDVGGTFTDIFAFDTATGEIKVAKVSTTRPDQSGGFLAGLNACAPDAASVGTVVHGTTAGTNALLERKGARAGVITTMGLRDILEMRRRDRPRTWGLRGDFTPVVPRDLRLEVSERTLADGTIRTAVDPDEVARAVGELQAAGCAAVAVLFANAYANPENERRAVETVRALWPNACVSASSEILPEIREFERFSTTALNAYLQPEVSGYLRRLEAALADEGFAGEFLIVQSNGGLMDVGAASSLPIRTALSGPAAGVIAAGAIAKAAGFENVITGDVGGTSFDVAMIANGDSIHTAETSIDFGMVVRTPMIEIATIGAGGGSIASVDKSGLLKVGPESAGSFPGPVAYGHGNLRPTTTDANIVLGRIDPASPIGALDALDVEAARKAIADEIGAPLGLTTEEAAEAILRIANAGMAGAIRRVSIERGFDPVRFTYMPFGGGGALHACALLSEVGLGRAIVPRHPGVTSAMGCVIADMRYDFVQTINATLDGLDPDMVRGLVQNHHDRGMAQLAAAGTAFADRKIVVELDMFYAGQTHTVAVRLKTAAPGGSVCEITAAEIADAFDATYRSTYGRLLENGARRIMNLRTSVIGEREPLDLSALAPEGGSVEEATRGTRPVFIAAAWHDTQILRRLALPVGATIRGPAILEQPDTTILIEPGFSATVDRLGNLLIEPEKAIA